MSIQMLRTMDPKEARKAILFFLYFFCVIAAFWALKPLRTSSVVKAFGPEYYPLFKQGLLIFLPIVVALYSMATCIMCRKSMAIFFTGIFMIGTWIFWYLFEFQLSGGVKIAFFFFVDTYITVMVTLFWTYLNDHYNATDAKMMYGFIGSGGILGGIVGSSISGWASNLLGNYIILSVTLFLVAIILIVMSLDEKLDMKKKICEKGDSSPFKVFAEGIQVVFKSKYLLGVAAIVGIYEIVSTVTDYQFNASSAAAFSDATTMAAFQGKVFFVAQIVAFLIQFFLTSVVHRKFGIVLGLLFLPLALLTGSAMFLLMPVLAVITFTIGSETAYSLATARQTASLRANDLKI